MTDKNQLLTPAQAAAVMGVSTQQVNYMIRHGTLPAVELSPRVRLVKRADALRAAKNRPKVGNPNCATMVLARWKKKKK